MSIDTLEEVLPVAEEAIIPVRPGGSPFYRVMKRVLDTVFAFVLLVVLAVPMLLIAFGTWLSSPGPAIFTQLRMGKDGKVFKIYKYRTMRKDAPHDLATSEFHDAQAYMTPIGIFLRRTSLDELPQLINILKGEMSFVGYRPVCLTEVKLNNLRQAYGVFAVRPGLTGLAQVKGRENLKYREKALLDAQYVEKQGFALDLWCLIMTVVVIITGEGAK